MQEDREMPAGAVRAGALNVVVLLLAGWILISPFFLPYANTDAANDAHLLHIGVGVVIGAIAVARIRQAGPHPRLALVVVAAALVLLAGPWLLGYGVDGWLGRPTDGPPPGPADNGYAPLAAVNSVVSAVAVILITALAEVVAAPRSQTRVVTLSSSAFSSRSRPTP